MNEGELLLKAILEKPEDDTVRLAYADYLDETAGAVRCESCGGKGYQLTATTDNGPVRYYTIDCSACGRAGTVPDGRAARAEFIRVQVELTALDRCIDRCRERIDFCCNTCLRESILKEVERELWGDWCESWTSPLPFGNPIDYKPSRGFVTHVTCTWEDWLKHGDAILAAEPVREVTFTTQPTVWMESYESYDGSGPRATLAGVKAKYQPAHESAQDIIKELSRREWGDGVVFKFHNNLSPLEPGVINQ